MTELCRSCLEPIRTKKYPLIGEIANVEVDVISMLEFCTSSKLEVAQGLPNSVCVSCFKTIRISYWFLKQFYEAQTKLTQLRHLLDGANGNGLEGEDNELISAIQICDNTNDVDGESESENDEEYMEEDGIFEDTTEFEHENENHDDEQEIFIKEESVLQDTKGDLSNLVELFDLGNLSNIEVVVDDEPKPDDEDDKVFMYICPICGDQFSRVETFYSHVSSYNLAKITCTRCESQPELDMDTYFNHYLDHHKYQCAICGKLMASAYGYHYHMRHHRNVRKFKCPFEGCTRSFLMNHLLTKHIKSHIVKNSYSCQLCDSTFNTKDALRYHNKQHFGHKDHLCTICGQAFFQAVHLRDHVYRHVGYKKFVCDICNRGFITKASLKKHLPYCSKKYNYCFNFKGDTN
ncbi:unnamed protein product [Phyllotreta striolata]|uniref:C2H2-type domain-containing protein n=1 Tax=Phyllotreta striolata TaxID=444603 RepID=A0A9N9TZ85_PHYSR|nr:unnamed protein product [Phyllotreta striolata]